MRADLLKSENWYLAFFLIFFSFLSANYYFLLILFFIVFATFLLVLEKFDFAIYALIFYLPFQIALNIAPDFDVASGRVFILFFLVVWVMKSLKNHKLIINFSLQTIIIFLFLFLATISVLQSFETERAFRKLLVFYSIFPLYFILTSFAGDKKFIKNLLFSLFASLSILSILAIAQFFSQFYFDLDSIMRFFSIFISPIFYGNTFGAEVISNPSWLVNIGGMTVLRAFAIFPDPHIFSFYLGLIIPLVFSLIYFEYSKKKCTRLGIFLFILFTLAFISEVFTFSRGGYLGMGFSFLVMILIFWKKFSLSQKRSWIAISLFFISGVIMFGGNVVKRFFSIFDLSEGSNSERLKNWSEGYAVFSDNLFSGVGIGNYSYYINPLFSYRDPVYAHNLYLDLGAEMGILVLLMWIALVLSTIFGLYGVSKRNRDPFLSSLSIGLIGSLVWFSVHSFFDTPIYAPQILSIFLVIISLSVLVMRCDKIKRESK